MKNESQNRHLTSQVVLGVLVIGMGLLFLFNNFGIIDIDRAKAFWPLVFVVAGVAKMFDTRSSSGYMFGAGLIGIGVLLILDRLGLVDFDWSTLWPLLLVGIGGMLLYRATAGRQLDAKLALKDGGDSDSFIDVAAILGGIERRVNTQALRGGEVTAIMGGCDLDMRAASIEGEAVLNVFAFWGGVTIKCPPDWTVVLQGTPVMGGFEEKTVAPPDNAKRLVIKGYAIMGCVEVRN